LVWIINYKNFYKGDEFVFEQCIYYFNIAIALAVAAIPEGLPAVITTCLALGTRKMAAKNAIVRKLPSVETLGCTSVICSDKTGTLTTNEMTITSVVHMKTASAFRQYDVDGLSYNPTGELIGLDEVTPVLQDVCKVCSLCNESMIEYDGESERYVRVGEPTEAALKILVEKIGHPDPSERASIKSERETDPGAVVQAVNSHYIDGTKKVATLEFSRDRKSMSVLCGSGSAAAHAPAGRQTRGSVKKAKKQASGGGNVLYVKGAPEGILDRCTHVRLEDGTTAAFTDAAKKQIKDQQGVMATQALRTLGLAMVEDTGSLSDYNGEHDHPAHEQLKKYENYAEIESEMVFIGLVGMKDPPRTEVRGAIESCKMAGIRVVVITGDNKRTAESVCRSIGVFGEDEDVEGKSFEGHDFFQLPEAEQKKVLSGKGGRVFSRTEPTHKQALVKILGELGHITAMTGDGVNDAPALKQADIGIAMGISGTEVAKEASDMVLADDNFATIVEAVSEGRSIYNNMQAFIRYLISSNIGEVAAIFFTAALTIPEGLIPVQLLWVNLVTDGPPATALGFNPPDKDIMKKLPRSKDDELINSWVFFRYMVVGIYVGVACVASFAFWYVAPHDQAYFGLTNSNDGHTIVSWDQLRDWNKCKDYYGPEKTVTSADEIPDLWKDFAPKAFTTTMGGHTWEPKDDPCTYFTDGKKKASTLSLSVLVAIEMLNALNALSEDGSLLHMPPWVNPYLIVAMLVSFGMHAVILYIPVSYVAKPTVHVYECYLITCIGRHCVFGLYYSACPTTFGGSPSLNHNSCCVVVSCCFILSVDVRNLRGPASGLERESRRACFLHACDLH
jgi:Ca2+-transporting ATPase